MTMWMVPLEVVQCSSPFSWPFPAKISCLF
jgi:hypothetical protein